VELRGLIKLADVRLDVRLTVQDALSAQPEAADFSAAAQFRQLIHSEYPRKLRRHVLFRDQRIEREVGRRQASGWRLSAAAAFNRFERLGHAFQGCAPIREPSYSRGEKRNWRTRRRTGLVANFSRPAGKNGEYPGTQRNCGKLPAALTWLIGLSGWHGSTVRAGQAKPASNAGDLFESFRR
jgi:hypothetical protein